MEQKYLTLPAWEPSYQSSEEAAPLVRSGTAMTQKICVQITREDIDGWGQDQCPHPLINALKRSTQTSWRLVEPVLVVEKAAPYRTLVLDSDMLMHLLECKHGSQSLPYECEIELILPFYD